MNTTSKMNETVKDTLKMRGDNMILYAAQRIEELEKANTQLQMQREQNFLQHGNPFFPMPDLS